MRAFCKGIRMEKQGHSIYSVSTKSVSRCVSTSSNMSFIPPHVRGGLAVPQRARNFLTRPPTGTPRRASSPCEGSPRPRVARAQGIARLPFFPFFFLYSSSRVLKGGGQGCPRLRASNEGLPRPRVLRAKRAPGCSRSSLDSSSPVG